MDALALSQSSMRHFLRRWTPALNPCGRVRHEAEHLPASQSKLGEEISTRRTRATSPPVDGGDRTPAGPPSAIGGRPPQSLTGAEVPSLLFNNFDRRFLDLGELAEKGLVLYVYPGCERSPVDGAQSFDADALQHRTYSTLRDRFAEVVPHGALVALSSIPPTQQFHRSPELAWDQDEDAKFPHYLVSDELLQLAQELGLPTFKHAGETYYERLTLVARDGRIQRVFHPVTPGQDARQALTWLRLH